MVSKNGKHDAPRPAPEAPASMPAPPATQDDDRAARKRQDEYQGQSEAREPADRESDVERPAADRADRLPGDDDAPRLDIERADE